MLKTKNMFSEALPEQNDIKKYLSIQKFSFKCLGVDITSEKRTVLRLLLIWLPMTLLVALSVIALIYAAESRSDLNLMTDILSPFWQYLLVLTKTLCFLWNEKKMVNLVHRIWLWSLEARGAELKIIKEENRKERLFALLFVRYIFSTAILALITPLLVAFICYLNGQGFMDKLDLPLKAGYHLVLNPKSCNGYLLAFLWNLIVTFFIMTITIGSDTLFSWFAFNVAAQFRILNLRFETTALSVRATNDDNNFIELIVAHIKYHQRVIELANYLNEVFMVTIFLSYAITFLEFGCLIFQISRDSEWPSLVFHISFMTTVCLQLMLYCYGGQMIIDKSSSVAMTIYEHFQWHEMSVKCKKLLLLPMMRAQKPCISTAIFFAANMHLYLWVFKTAGSFYALLKSVETR